MSDPGMKVMIAGNFASNRGGLEESYAKAFESLGCPVVRFEFGRAVSRSCRLGRFGRTFNRFVPVESWLRKANRELVVAALKEKPSMVIVAGQNPVTGGGLAQIAAALAAKRILLWPDTLLNVSDSLISALPMYDLVACYGRLPCAIFGKLGAGAVEWVPLAGDPVLHPSLVTGNPRPSDYSCDVSFVGTWRPEREEALAAICAIPEIRVKIWGDGNWKRFAGKNPMIMKAWQGKGLYGAEFSAAVAGSKINLNVIDDTNYPSANMRFFEIPCAGGLEVSSPCPEMEPEFRDGETIFYYRKVKELPELIVKLLGDDKLRADVTRRAHEKILSGHTYRHRADKILTALDSLQGSS